MNLEELFITNKEDSIKGRYSNFESRTDFTQIKYR
jgi:hypothetical protein